jgi:hypothetical protein
MKETKDGRGYFMYRCRNCGVEFYSNLIEPPADYTSMTIDRMFKGIVNATNPGTGHSIPCIEHDCNEIHTGVADLIGYTAGAGIIK